jgi:hypothetical protein
MTTIIIINKKCRHVPSRDNSVRIAKTYGHDGRRSISGKGNGFVFSIASRQGSGVYLAFYPMNTDGYSPGRKAAWVLSYVLWTSRMVELYFHSPLRLHDVAIEQA